MWEWLLSRLRWRRRSSSPRARRARSWPLAALLPDSGPREGTAVTVPPGPPGSPDGGPPGWPEGGRHRRGAPPGAEAPPGGGALTGGGAPSGRGTPPGWAGDPASGASGAPGAPGIPGSAATGYARPGPPAGPGPEPPGGTSGSDAESARAGASRRAAGGGRARIRRRQPGPDGSPPGTQPGRAGPASAAAGGRTAARRHGQRPSGQRSPGQHSSGRGSPGRGSSGRGRHHDAAGQGREAGQGRGEAAETRPWYEVAGAWQQADGSAHCGSLEPLVRRQWESAETAPAANFPITWGNINNPHMIRRIFSPLDKSKLSALIRKSSFVIHIASPHV